MQGSSPTPAHVVIFPYDEHGHVTPAFALGRALARQGLRVTGVLTASRYVANGPRTPAQTDLFHIITIPDSSSVQADSSKQDNVCYQQSLQRLEPGFEELMLRLQPPPSCLISDILFPWSQDLADRLGIPRFHIWVFPAIIPLLLFCVPALYEKGLLPFRQEMGEELVDLVPLLPKQQLRLRDFPVDFLSRDSKQLSFLFHILKGMKRAAGAVINTVYELEPEVVEAIAAPEVGLRSVYTLGSMSSLEEALSTGHESQQLSQTITDNDGCLHWLDTQPRASVVYVALGSMVTLTEEEIEEMALGLEASGQPFLWVLRSRAAVQQDPLLDGFLQRTAGRGRIVTWAPQTAVLAHISIGCFITHCGMGSLLEALSAGVPMIGGFSKLSEQNTNLYRLCSEEWGAAIPLQEPGQGMSSVPPLRSSVEKCVKEVIHGERGQALSRNALKLKAKVNNAVAAPNGSSYLNLLKLTHTIQCFKKA